MISSSLTLTTVKGADNSHRDVSNGRWLGYPAIQGLTRRGTCSINTSCVGFIVVTKNPVLLSSTTAAFGFAMCKISFETLSVDFHPHFDNDHTVELDADNDFLLNNDHIRICNVHPRMYAAGLMLIKMSYHWSDREVWKWDSFTNCLLIDTYSGSTVDSAAHDPVECWSDKNRPIAGQILDDRKDMLLCGGNDGILLRRQEVKFFSLNSAAACQLTVCRLLYSEPIFSCRMTTFRFAMAILMPTDKAQLISVEPVHIWGRAASRRGWKGHDRNFKVGYEGVVEREPVVGEGKILTQTSILVMLTKKKRVTSEMQRAARARGLQVMVRILHHLAFLWVNVFFPQYSGACHDQGGDVYPTSDLRKLTITVGSKGPQRALAEQVEEHVEGVGSNGTGQCGTETSCKRLSKTANIVLCTGMKRHQRREGRSWEQVDSRGGCTEEGVMKTTLNLSPINGCLVCCYPYQRTALQPRVLYSRRTMLIQQSAHRAVANSTDLEDTEMRAQAEEHLPVAMSKNRNTGSRQKYIPEIEQRVEMMGGACGLEMASERRGAQMDGTRGVVGAETGWTRAGQSGVWRGKEDCVDGGCRRQCIFSQGGGVDETGHFMHEGGATSVWQGIIGTGCFLREGGSTSVWREGIETAVFTRGASECGRGRWEVWTEAV
ncbi:hypothetical protein EDD18DRAFT_1105932 [Armillaria luteobubalina]|uniref:Uncharacterized protein n=1 Tax=Armillaria luteobubalina TaxID=153913 RepID=A0AA39Q4D3_9AGAR|nr:hypothetical protein EDD18DRAFT_1105932 [Armillaria luteobubalina]